MRILITGAAGQLGRCMKEVLSGDEVHGVDLPAVDIADRGAVERVFAEADPEIVVNCAAFTNVDGCVTDYATAHRANAVGPLNLAVACRAAGIPMLHVSTNEVFDGSRREGYEEWMPVAPVNRYGMSKAAGEFNVRSVLPEHYIVRTAWLFAAGGRNFVHAILNKAQGGGPLRVVDDEVGNPTHAPDLAGAITSLIRTGSFGTYHFVNEGACSRWEFAGAILRAAGMTEVKIEPISSSEFERASTPPQCTGLHNLNGAALGIRLRPWQEAVANFVSKGLKA